MHISGSSLLTVPFLVTAMLLASASTPVSAMASAGPFPMPFRNADYDSRLLPPSDSHALRPHSHRWVRSYEHNASTLSHHHEPSEASSSLSAHKAHESSVSAASRSSASRFHRRQYAGLGVLLSSLQSYSSGSQADSQDLQGMASQSASQDENDPANQQAAAAKFSSFQQNAQGFSGILAQLAADKGLANYDKNDELQTALKEFINANKDALSAVNTLIQNDPALGPILGPIVYEIKCIVDDILDITENLTDGLLNSLKPLLTGLSGNAGAMTCSSQLKLLGFCI